MPHHDRYTSIVWGILGIYIAYEGYRLKLGTLKNPQCGFLIFWTGMILSGLSMILFLQTFIQPMNRKMEKSLWSGIDWMKGMKMMGALFIYALVFRWLGFIPSTFLLLLFLFKGIEPQRWSTSLILSLATIAVCYIVFGVFLELQFPSGLLARILGH